MNNSARSVAMLAVVLACTEPNSLDERAPLHHNPRIAAISASNQYGLNVGPLSGTSGESVASFMTQGDMGWVRSTIYWWDVENMAYWYNPHNCQLDVNTSRDTGLWNWIGPDELYNRAMAHGLNVEFILYGTPCNESQKKDSAEAISVHANGDTVGWKHFVQQAVNRYPNVKVWAIWNEPNDIGQYTGAPGLSRTQAYSQLLATAAPIIHAAGDSVVALELGDGSTDGIPVNTWISEVFQQVGSQIDILGLHSYHESGTTNLVNTASSAATAASPSSPGRNNIWVTEAGTPQESPGDYGLAVDVTSFVNQLRSGNAPAWKKVFYWNGYMPPGEGRNVFVNDGTNPVTGRMAYYAYKCSIQGQPLGGCALRINGPTLVKPNVTCSWTVTADYAIAGPYEWRKDGTIVGTNSTELVMNTGSTSFSLWAQVQPSSNVSKSIAVSSSAPRCLF